MAIVRSPFPLKLVRVAADEAIGGSLMANVKFVKCNEVKLGLAK